MKKERRKNIRYQVVDEAYAALGRNYSKVGRIKNISLGGLAFNYITNETEYQNITIIDIFIENTPFGLYNIPCSLVYDRVVKTPEVKDRYTDLLTTRRCGIKFGRLVKDDEKQLRKFISVHTEKLAK